MSEALFALALATGTGMQACRWALTEMRGQNSRRDVASTRVERMREHRAGMPRYEGIAWTLIFLATAADAVGVIAERI